MNEERSGRKPNEFGASTLAVHGGEAKVRADRSLTPPVVLSSTYPFVDTAELVRYMEGEQQRPHEYGRYGNPTVQAVEAKLAALEGAESALLVASGMAAVCTTLFALLRAGQKVVLTSDVYRKTRQFALQVLTRFGVEVEIVAADVAAIEAAIDDRTRVVFSEMPTNPYLRLFDVDALVAVARRHKCKTIVDATFATPVNFNPLARGIDLVVHSTTKYLAGHNDVLGGCVVGAAPIVQAIRELAWTLGPNADPQAAYLLARGLKTLALRLRQQNATAARLAEVLERHHAVRRVYYPMLPSHPDHVLALRYLRGGGAVVSFELVGGLAAGTRFVDALELSKLAPSLGGVESLIEQPALMSYYELSSEQREAVGIRDGLVRWSLGIEDVEDLERDAVRALDAL